MSSVGQFILNLAHRIRENESKKLQHSKKLARRRRVKYKKSMLLSKSDFKVARTCPTKLYYKKLGYPSALDADQYLAFLADGGYMIETIAKLLHSEGFEIGFDGGPEESFARTIAALQAENVTLFEATLISNGRIARVDILEKVGTNFRLIEVKAKSVDTRSGDTPFRGAKGGIRSEWQPYLEDVTFQTILLEELFPHANVVPYLRLVDRAKTTSIDCIYACFTVSARSGEGGFARPVVHFTGDVGALRKEHFLADLAVTNEVLRLRPEVQSSSIAFVSSIQSDVAKLKMEIGAHCRDCEYRFDSANQPEKNGFGECWGQTADVSPHILDYYKAGSIGRRGVPLIDTIVKKGRASLYDIAEAHLVKADGTVGSDAARQRIQRQFTESNSEFVRPDLPAILHSHSHPLHFVDFETSRVAVPYHAGMRPYEQVAFQWSCHTLNEDGSVVHTEWINVENAFPSFDFAVALMNQLGIGGTVYTWSHHERTTLADIRRQLEAYRTDMPVLRQWLDNLLAGSLNLKIVDLCAIASTCYFHPAMKGKLSLKYVLPAVWGANPALRADPLFVKYYRAALNGEPVNPYETLAPLPFADDELGDEPGEVVREGTGAMRAYQEMLFGLSKNDSGRKAQWIRLLLQYCELDTAAMLIVWRHWECRTV